MRIGIDCRLFRNSPTGIGRYTAELVAYLEEHDQLNDYYLFLSAKEYHIYAPRYENFHKVYAPFSHYSFSEQVFFPFLLYRYRLHVMHFTHFNAPIWYFGKSIVTIHDLTLSFFPGRRFHRRYHRWAYQWVISGITKRAKKVICVSKNTRKDIIEVLDVPSKKIEVIYNGVNQKQFYPHDQKVIKKIKTKYNLPNIYLLYTGIWQDHKNLLRLVDIFWDISHKYKHVDLVLTGKENSMNHNVEEAVLRSKVPRRIHAIGCVSEEDIGPLYAGAYAIVLPSMYDGFWLPLLEGMASGVPVICSTTPSFLEIVERKYALLFHCASRQEMVEALETVITDTKIRKNLIQMGKERVNQFSWEKTGEQTLKVYKQCKNE